MTTTATPTTPSPTAPAAVVVAALGRVQPGRLGRVLGALVDELGDRATLHVLHTGLDPLAVEAAVWAHPDVTFISAHRDHYEQFGPAGRARSELLLLDCLRVEGSERVVVAPVDPGAVRIVAAAATAPRPVPAAVPVGPGSGVAVTPPVPAPRLEVGASSSHVLVLDGALATRAVRRHVDLTLARARRNRKTLSLALEAAVATGLGTVAAVPFPPAPESGPEDGDEIEVPESTVGDLLATAEELYADADYAGAREVLLQAVRLPHGLTDRVALALSRVLRATSDYVTARDVLLLAHGDSMATSRALAEEAEIAWIQHDHEASAELATYALRANLSNRRAEVALRRAQRPLTTAEAVPERTGAAPVLSHVAFYVSDRGNFGDVVLPHAVREAVGSVLPGPGWLPVHVHQVFDRERLELVNATDGVVVGGGGLFLPDTSPNGNSGWQWNVPREQLEAIEVPLGVVAVGYNLFHGQTFHSRLFRESLTALVDRAALVGLRNHGSVDQVRNLLPTRLADRIRFLPCPTTVLRHIHGEPAGAVLGGSGTVLLNAAFDRSARRFGDGYERFLADMAWYVRELRTAGAEVRFAAHLATDEQLVDDLFSEYGIRVPVDALYLLPVEEGYDVYRRASVVVGMRGHATMIPFGLGTPVLSLVSHPKMRYFLSDIGREEWGYDVHRDGLAAALAEHTLEIIGKEQEYRADVAAIQEELLAVIRGELATFATALGVPVTPRAPGQGIPVPTQGAVAIEPAPPAVPALG